MNLAHKNFFFFFMWNTREKEKNIKKLFAFDSRTKRNHNFRDDFASDE